jgi:hypothetical protein
MDLSEEFEFLVESFFHEDPSGQSKTHDPVHPQMPSQSWTYHSSVSARLHSSLKPGGTLGSRLAASTLVVIDHLGVAAV